MRRKRKETKRGTILLMVVGLLSMLFIIISAYLTLARFERQTSQQIRQGREIDDIIDTVNELVMQKLIEQWTDNNGNMLSDGANLPDNFAFADIPGYRGSGVQASHELVRAATSMLGSTSVYITPAVTMLNGYIRSGSTVSVGYSRGGSVDWLLDDLLPVWSDRRHTTGIASSAYLASLSRFARDPYTDADGDGIGDSYLPGLALASELAGAIAGVPVRVPTGEPAFIWPPSDSRSVPARRFLETARYITSVRVIPNSGMVSLDVPFAHGEFLQHTFAYVNKEPAGTAFPPSGSGMSLDDFIRRMRAEAPSIEPLLRRRGALPSAGIDPTNPQARRDADFARVPAIVRMLENDYERTFVSGFRVGQSGQEREHYQRFNLGHPRGNEWERARQGLWLDATTFNVTIPLFDQSGANVGAGGFAVMQFYDRRHLFTSKSNSDELARKQGSPPNPPGQPFGTRAGELKFYLGDIDQCYRVDPGTGVVRFDSIAAQPVLRRIMNLYYDMLEGYKDWKTVAGNPNEEAVSRLQQAAMLTVNTVAFAAPRTADQNAQLPGFIDVVRFSPGTISPAPVYYGYGPQPFITQAIVYRDDDDARAVGVEFYNPNEPFRVRSINDEHALYLPQFAVSLNNEYDDPINGISPGALRPLDWSRNIGIPRRFPGRRFMTLSISNSGGNGFFKGRSDGGEIDLAVGLNGNGKITIKLWRADFETALTSNPAGTWHLVDKFTVPDADPPQSGVGQWLSTYRDTRAEDYFGLDTSRVPAVPTRWRMALGFRDTDRLYPTASRGSGPPSGTIMITYGAVGPGHLPAVVPFGPTTPLYTMNAPIIEPNGLRISIRVHDVDRPPSFPTVGFMHFVPRFSHVRQAATDFEPMSAVLRDQWMARNYSFTTSQSPPADFGHMPIFDNEQKADAGGQFDDARAGRIPWGLLVYDYFTTLDPSTVDPYRVPGRININAAPWWVLASLPVVEPATLFGEYGRMMTPPSPAFWSGAGILFGVGNEPAPGVPLPRYAVADSPRTAGVPLISTADPSWHYLGPRLAQSIASYRDRIQYALNVTTEFWNSDDRMGYRSTPIYVGMRLGSRPSTSNPRKYGFVSVGELANVKGFASTIYDPANGLPVLDPAIQVEPPLSVFNTMRAQPRAADFFKAVSLMAMLDSHFLTTRGNTFTVYVSVMDRENPQASVRSQITVDRSNLLPQLIPGRGTLQSRGMPAIIAQRQIAYSNTRFDD